MLRRLLFLIALLSPVTVLHAQSLPQVYLSGTFGTDYQPATVVIDGETFSAQVKWRGGSTAASNKHKHNYTVKFDSNVSFFGLRSDDTWILDAGQADPFRLRNRIATDVWLSYVSKPYYASQQPEALNAARGRVVEVWLNDEYIGIYNFSENVDRKQLKLKKFDTRIRGVLWKAKAYGYATFWEVNDDYNNSQDTWNVFETKYPEVSDFGYTDYQTLYEALNFCVNSTDEEFCAHIGDYIDMPVLIDYYLFINVMGAVDNCGKNLFWAVYDQTDDRRITPAIWDLDLTVAAPALAKIYSGFVNPRYDIFSGIGVLYRLITLDPDNFNRRAYERYQQLRQTVFHVDSLSKRYHDAANMLYNTGAAQREKNRWSGDSDIGGLTINFRRDADSIARYLAIRLPHLDTVLCDTAINFYMAVEPVKAAVAKQSSVIYNLKGQRLSSSAALPAGLYIRNGRKYLIKK